MAPWPAILLALHLPAAGAEDLAPGWRLDRFRWSGIVTGGKTVEVRNDYGDIRTRHADGGELEVSAVIQIREGDADPPRVVVTDGPDRLVVSAVLGEARPSPGETDPARRSHRADLVILLPGGLPLVARARTGLVEAKGLDAPADVATEGNILVSTRGRLVARTAHGSIEARFGQAAWPEPSRLETVTGPIRVQLPQAPSLTAEVTTAGEISTDFTVTIEPLDDGLRKTARWRIGEGTHLLQLHTEKGNVRLLRFPN